MKLIFLFDFDGTLVIDKSVEELIDTMNRYAVDEYTNNIGAKVAYGGLTVSI